MAPQVFPRAIRPVSGQIARPGRSWGLLEDARTHSATHRLGTCNGAPSGRGIACPSVFLGQAPAYWLGRRQGNTEGSLRPSSKGPGLSRSPRPSAADVAPPHTPRGAEDIAGTKPGNQQAIQVACRRPSAVWLRFEELPELGVRGNETELVFTRDIRTLWLSVVSNLTGSHKSAGNVFARIANSLRSKNLNSATSIAR